MIDKTMIRFVLVGIINTLVGTAVMFSFYNIFHSAIGYLLPRITLSEVSSVIF